MQVKHFLLIGCLGTLIGSVVFLYLLMSRAKTSLPHVLMFIAAAASSMCFYAMWTGVGVECVPPPPVPICKFPCSLALIVPDTLSGYIIASLQTTQICTSSQVYTAYHSTHENGRINTRKMSARVHIHPHPHGLKTHTRVCRSSYDGFRRASSGRGLVLSLTPCLSRLSPLRDAVDAGSRQRTSPLA